MQISGSDLRLLTVFETVVRHGGFAAAQAELNVAQSTISNHIAALENRLGVRLCQRGRGGFRLTAKGELVLEATRRLIASIDTFSEDVADLKGHLVGDLKIGLVDCIATDPNCRLHEAVARFEAHPNKVTLHIGQEAPQSLQEKVLDGRYHLGIGSFPHKISGLTYEPLYEEVHGLYCGADHRLFSVSDAELDDDALRREPIVCRGYWRETYRRSIGFENAGAFVHQIEPQLLLILSGKYLGFLPDHFARRWVGEGRLRQLACQSVAYRCGFDLILKSGHRQTQIVETFLEALRAVYEPDLRPLHLASL